jgi:hypothetical protein
MSMTEASKTLHAHWVAYLIEGRTDRQGKRLGETLVSQSTGTIFSGWPRAALGEAKFCTAPPGPERQIDLGVELTRKIALDDHASESAVHIHGLTIFQLIFSTGRSSLCFWEGRIPSRLTGYKNTIENMKKKESSAWNNYQEKLTDC